MTQRQRFASTPTASYEPVDVLFYGGTDMPILSKETVQEAQFDARFDDWSMRTLLDTLVVDTLASDPERLRRDHVRDMLVVERFAVLRAWGKVASPGSALHGAG